MKKVFNECVGCTDMGLPCKGSSCPNRSVTRFFCDKCDNEAQLYYYGDKELCLDCIEELLEKVNDEY